METRSCPCAHELRGTISCVDLIIVDLLTTPRDRQTGTLIRNAFTRLLSHYLTPPAIFTDRAKKWLQEILKHVQDDTVAICFFPPAFLLYVTFH